MSDDQETLFEFPCEYPVKAMGRAAVGLEDIVFNLIKRHAPELRHEDIQTKPSSGGKYISVTATITATSKAQLDSLYLELSGHPDILMAF